MEEYQESCLVRIREKVQEVLGENCIVTAGMVSNGGGRQKGLCIVPIENFPGMSMSVGIKEMMGYGWDIEDAEACAEGVVRMYAENKEILESHGFTKELVKWEKVESLIYPLLLSVKENGEILQELAHSCMLDFAVAYMIRMNPGEKEPWAIVKVTERIFSLWDIGKDMLHQAAMENMKKDGFVVLELADLAHGMYVGNLENAVSVSELKKGKRYILTNRPLYYGAAAILDKELLKKISGGEKLYILPMDVHSVMVVKDDGMIQEKYCNEAVWMMNGADDTESATFTNHAYCYDGEKDELRECHG